MEKLALFSLGNSTLAISLTQIDANFSHKNTHFKRVKLETHVLSRAVFSMQPLFQDCGSINLEYLLSIASVHSAASSLSSGQKGLLLKNVSDSSSVTILLQQIFFAC